MSAFATTLRSGSSGSADRSGSKGRKRSSQSPRPGASSPRDNRLSVTASKSVPSVRPSVLSKQSRSASTGQKRPKGETSTIKVAVRMRPLSAQERKIDSWETAEVTSGKIVTLFDPKDKSSADPLQRSRETRYAFDVAVDHNSDNRTVYELAASDVVGKVISGQHGTVFAYGATGSGKTYTMSGTKDNPGVMYYLIKDLFKMVGDLEHPVELTASYLEIYNENLRDLLNDEDTGIELREDPIKGVTVAGVTEYEMNSAEDVFDILKRGSVNRTTDSHLLNAASSRSHAVLMIAVQQFNERRLLTKSANLTMIDLAGSERAKKSGTNKKMLREGANINRSLLSLANCINALGRGGKGVFVPYRDSKLTRLLKDSLSGWAHTVMIANFSVASSQFDETRETLLYANRAKNIKVTDDMLEERKRAQRQEMKSGNYKNLVAQLTKELTQLKNTLQPQRRMSMAASVMSGTRRLSAESHMGSAVPEDEAMDEMQVEDMPQFAGIEPEEVAKIMAARRRSTGGSGFARRDSVFEVQTTERLVNGIVSNFQEIVQLRRSLTELEETDDNNQAELKRHEEVIEEWDASAGDDSDLEDAEPPDNVQRARLEKEALLVTIQHNSKYKRDLNKRLRDAETQGEQLREEISKQNLKAERQQILFLTLERCVLELQKMELEFQVRVFTKELDQVQSQADYYRSTLDEWSIPYSSYSRFGGQISSEPLPAAPDLKQQAAAQPLGQVFSKIKQDHGRLSVLRSHPEESPLKRTQSKKKLLQKLGVSEAELKPALDQQELVKAKNALLREKQQSAALEQSLKKQEEQVGKLEERLADAQHRMQEQEVELEQLLNEQNEWTATEVRLRGEVEEASKRVDHDRRWEESAAAAEIVKLKAENKRLRQQHEENIQNSPRAMDLPADIVRGFRNEALEDMRVELQEERARSLELEADLSAALQKQEGLLKTIRRLRAQRQDGSAEPAGQQRELEKLRERLLDLQREHNEERERARTIERELEGNIRQEQRLSQELRDAVRHGKEQLNNYKKRVRELTIKLDEAMAGRGQVGVPQPDESLYAATKRKTVDSQTSSHPASPRGIRDDKESHFDSKVTAAPLLRPAAARGTAFLHAARQAQSLSSGPKGSSVGAELSSLVQHYHLQFFNQLYGAPSMSTPSLSPQPQARQELDSDDDDIVKKPPATMAVTTPAAERSPPERATTRAQRSADRKSRLNIPASVEKSRANAQAVLARAQERRRQHRSRPGSKTSSVRSRGSSNNAMENMSLADAKSKEEEAIDAALDASLRNLKRTTPDAQQDRIQKQAASANGSKSSEFRRTRTAGSASLRGTDASESFDRAQSMPQTTVAGDGDGEEEHEDEEYLARLRGMGEQYLETLKVNGNTEKEHERTARNLSVVAQRGDRDDTELDSEVSDSENAVGAADFAYSAAPHDAFYYSNSD